MGLDRRNYIYERIEDFGSSHPLFDSASTCTIPTFQGIFLYLLSQKCVKIRAERAKNWVSSPTYLTHAHTLKNSKITPVMLAFKNSQKIFHCNTKIAD